MGLHPLVSGGIVYDFGPRDNSVYPDKRLGRAALENARSNRFPLGARGAGISATVGKGLGSGFGEPAGQGAAFARSRRQDLRVCRFECGWRGLRPAGQRGSWKPGFIDRRTVDFHGGDRTPGRGRPACRASAAGNTTLTVVVTNQTLFGFNLTQLARQVHSSMARAIQPFHTDTDGDALWVVSTREVEMSEWSVTALGVVASEVVWDAVLVAHP